MVPEKLLTDLVESLTGSFKQALATQEEHARKMAKENQLMRSKLTSLLKQARSSSSSTSLSTVPIPVRDERDPLWFGKLDLMTLVPTGGPSSFGRALGAAMFGEEDKCQFINFRIGQKMSKSNARKPCSKTVEDVFRQCVARNFVDNAEAATEMAIGGANQYGIEMRQKHPSKVSNEAKENIPPSE